MFNFVRLENKYIELFVETARQIFGSSAKLYLFGSRVDDSKRGGDIDLYLETDIKEDLLYRKIIFLAQVKKVIGERKIDLVVNNGLHYQYIYDIAKEEGILLR